MPYANATILPMVLLSLRAGGSGVEAVGNYRSHCRRLRREL